MTPQRVNKQAEIDTVGDDRTGRFIASSTREDRYGDIIEQNWDLSDFFRNPVFLWGHQSYNTPIGWVREFTPAPDGQTTASRVEFLPEGTDAFVDKLFSLVRLRAIRAVSVGFIPMEIEDRFDGDHHWIGWRYIRSQLIELSLCSVPANPDALQLARSLDPHPAFLRRVCAEAPLIRPGSEQPAAAPQIVGKFQRRKIALDDLLRLKAVS
jgi:hypothetical protein